MVNGDYKKAKLRCQIVLVGISILFALLIQQWPGEQNNSTLLSVLGGIKIEEDHHINLLAMGRWLFVLGFFLVILGIDITAFQRAGSMALYRYKNIDNWWNAYFFAIHKNILLYYMSIIITVLLYNDEKTGIDTILVILTYYLHLCCLISFILAFDIVFQKRGILGIVVVFEGFLYILTLKYSCMWLVPGMYVCSSWYIVNGFEGFIVFLLELLMIVLFWKMVPFLWKKGILERKNVIDGNGD